MGMIMGQLKKLDNLILGSGWAVFSSLARLSISSLVLGLVRRENALLFHVLGCLHLLESRVLIQELRP